MTASSGDATEGRSRPSPAPAAAAGAGDGSASLKAAGALSGKTPSGPAMRMLRPLEPVGQGPRILLGISFFVLFVAAWAFATLGGFVSRTFLADPLTMVQ